MSSYLPVPTTVEFPGAELRDSLSINSGSRLMINEGPRHSESTSQQYELRNIPASRQNMHAINRKPVPTSSAPWHSPLPECVNLRNSPLREDCRGPACVSDIINAQEHETGDSYRNDVSLGAQADTRPFLQAEGQTHQEDAISEQTCHSSSLRLGNSDRTIGGPTPHQKSSFIHRLWLWEVAASAFSLACMASIIGVLSYEQGRRLDQWGLGKGFFSPTVVVSFLGTLAKSACLLVLTEIISQLKWLHFQHKSQTLSDLQLFDNASRGPWGAFQLVSRRNRKTIIASFASILVIASLLVDPFIQSVFRLPVLLTEVEGVSPGILETRVYDPALLNARFGQCYGAASVESEMQAAILAPIWNATRAPSLPCSFERCDWPTITTLGVCSSCEDLTDTVVPTCIVHPPNEIWRLIDCNYTVPSRGATFNAVFGATGGASVRVPYSTLWNSLAGEDWFTNLRNAYNFQKDPTFTQSGPAVISDFTFVKFPPNIIAYEYVTGQNGLRTIPPVSQAMHCTLELCARTFTTPFYANFSAAPLAGPRTALVTTTDGTTQGSAARVFIGLKPASPGQLSEDVKFRINYCNYKDIARYLQDLFTTSMSTTGVVGTTNDSSTAGASQLRQRITPGLGLAFSQSDSIADLMDEVADSMTEAFRTSANNTVLNGVAMSSVTYIEIIWPRLILPISLILLTFVILIVMIIRNNQRGMPIWKSSSLALLFHELSGWSDSKSAVVAAGPEEVEERARSMRTKVTNDDGKLLFSKAE